jgi:hypothetical protein
MRSDGFEFALIYPLAAGPRARRETGNTHDMMKRMLGRDDDMVKQSSAGWERLAER